jgi:hypothetical protein
VLLSTTPTIAGTPLHGPNTNLAGVFQINDVAKVRGRMRAFNPSQPGGAEQSAPPEVGERNFAAAGASSPLSDS